MLIITRQRCGTGSSLESAIGSNHGYAVTVLDSQPHPAISLEIEMAANDKVERIECEDEEQRLDRISKFLVATLLSHTDPDSAENLADNLLATLDSSPITSRGVTRTPLDSLLAQPPSEIDSTQTAQCNCHSFFPRVE